MAGGLLAAPLAAEAQQKVRIGYLARSAPVSEMTGSEPREPLLRAFLQGLRDLGYVYGENFVVEPLSAEGNADRFPLLAAEMVRLKVDIVLVGTNAAAHALKNATNTIPVVIAGAGDPVGTGLVTSLARPGGNITGLLSPFDPDMTGKRLQLLKAAAPKISRVVVIDDWGGKEVALSPRIQTAAQALRLTLSPVNVRRPDDYPAAFSAIIRQSAEALFVGGGSVNYVLGRRMIVEFAAQHRLPTIFPYREYVDAGGLMAYGANVAEIHRRAATYVDKILKGAKAADLPMEQPTTFELVINLKTAKALGLTIPPSVLGRADQ